MKYTIEMYCCDYCHARATNNEVMNSVLGYKNSNDWFSRFLDDERITVGHFCSEKCLNEARTSGKILS